MSRVDEIRERWSKVRYECGAADENAYADDVGYLLSCIEGRGVEDDDKRLLSRAEIGEIEHLQEQRRRNPVAQDAWLYVAEIDRLLDHIRYAEIQGYVDQLDANLV